MSEKNWIFLVVVAFAAITIGQVFRAPVVSINGGSGEIICTDGASK